MKVGDIVLVSYREFEIGTSTRSGEEKGDVLHKYETTDYGKLRKDAFLNMALFTTIETQDLTKISIAKVAMAAQEDGYVFEAADNEVVEGDEERNGKDEDWFEDGDEDGAPAGGAGVRVAPKVGAAKKPAAADDDDIDIDNI